MPLKERTLEDSFSFIRAWARDKEAVGLQGQRHEDLRIGKCRDFLDLYRVHYRLERSVSVYYAYTSGKKVELRGFNQIKITNKYVNKYPFNKRDQLVLSFVLLWVNVVWLLVIGLEMERGGETLRCRKQPAGATHLNQHKGKM